MALIELVNILSNGLPVDARCDRYNELKNILIVQSFTQSEILLVINLIKVLKQDLIQEVNLKCSNLANDIWELLIRGYKNIYGINKYVDLLIFKDMSNDRDLFEYNINAFSNILEAQVYETVSEEDFFIQFEKGVDNQKKLVKALIENCQTLPTEMCFKYIHLRAFPQIFSGQVEEDRKECLFDLIMKMPLGFAHEFMTPEITEKFKTEMQKKYIPFVQIGKSSIKWWNYAKALIHYSGKMLHTEIEITNSILKLIGVGFKTKTIEDRCGSYECWKVLIENYNLDPTSLVQKRIKLILKPLAATLTKNNTVNLKRFEAFTFFIETLNNTSEESIEVFLDFCFGPLTPSNNPNQQLNINQGQTMTFIFPKSSGILLKLLGHKRDLACCKNKTLGTVDTYNINQFVFGSNLAQHFDMIMQSIMVCSKLTMVWAKGYEGVTLVNCLWLCLLNLFRKVPEIEKEEITKKLFVGYKIVLKTSETNKHYYDAVGKPTLKCFATFISNNNYDEIIHLNLVSPLLDAIIMHNINTTELKLPKSIFGDVVSPLLSYSKNGDFIKEIENFLKPKYNKSEFIVDIIPYAFNHCVKLLSQKECKSEGKYKSFLLNLLMYSVAQETSTISHTWECLKLNLNKVDMSAEILSRLKLEFQANPKLIFKMIKIIPHIFQFVTKYDVQFFADLLEFIEMCFSVPLLTQDNEPDFTTILNKIIKYQKNYELECSPTLIFNCFETVIKVHKTYSVLSILLDYVNPSIRSSFPLSLQNLIFDLSLSASEDISIKALEIVAKLENPRKSVLISSNSMSRGAKIATMAKNNNSPNSNSSTNVNVLRLFGQDIDTQSPLKVKGSLLDKEIFISSDRKTLSATPPKTSLNKCEGTKGKINNKTPTKINHDFLNELSESQFVVVDKEVNFNSKEITDHQKEVIRRQREEIPALYEGLSQSVSQSLDFTNNTNVAPEVVKPIRLKKVRRSTSIDKKEPDIFEKRSWTKQEEANIKQESATKTKRKSESKQVEGKAKKSRVSIGPFDEVNLSFPKTSLAKDEKNDSNELLKTPLKEGPIIIKNILKEQIGVFATLGHVNKNVDSINASASCNVLCEDSENDKIRSKSPKEVEKLNEVEQKRNKVTLNENESVIQYTTNKNETVELNKEKGPIEETNAESTSVKDDKVDKDNETNTGIKFGDQEEKSNKDKENISEHNADKDETIILNKRELNPDKESAKSLKHNKTEVEIDESESQKLKLIKEDFKLKSNCIIQCQSIDKIESLLKINTSNDKNEDQNKGTPTKLNSRKSDNSLKIVVKGTRSLRNDIIKGRRKSARPSKSPDYSPKKDINKIGIREASKKKIRETTQTKLKEKSKMPISAADAEHPRKRGRPRSKFPPGYEKNSQKSGNKKQKTKVKLDKEQRDVKPLDEQQLTPDNSNNKNIEAEKQLSEDSKTIEGTLAERKSKAKRTPLESLLNSLKMDIVGAEEFTESRTKRIPKPKSDSSPAESTSTLKANKKKGRKSSILSLKTGENNSKVDNQELDEEIDIIDVLGCESEDIIENSENVSNENSIDKVRTALFTDDYDDNDEDFNRNSDGSRILPENFDEDLEKESIEDIIGVPKKANLDDTLTIDVNDSLSKINPETETQTLSMTTNVSSCQSLNLELTPDKDDRAINCSPVTDDTPNRNSELLNSTFDISPIKTTIIDSTTEQRNSPDMFSNEEEMHETEFTQDKIHDENEEDCLKSTYQSSRLPNLHPNPLMRSQKTFFENSIKPTNISSPKTDRVRKMMQNCEENKKNAEVPTSDEDLCALNNIDVLKFDREVPSPLALPKISILKRKIPDYMEEGSTPLAKRKRVNFSDPPTTSEKIYFKEVSENCHFKKKRKKTFNMASQLNKCMHDSIRGMQDTIEGLASEEVTENTDNLKQFCENGVDYLRELSLCEDEDPNCSSLSVNLAPPQSSAKDDDKYSMAFQMLEVIKTCLNKKQRLELYENALIQQFDPEERQRLGNALINAQNHNNL